jgi:MFS family permease
MSHSPLNRDADSRWSELLEPQLLLYTAMLSLGVALFAFNVFFVATAMPTAIKELGGEEYISWTFALYLAFAIASGAAASLLKEKFGTRTVFLVASAVFCCGTVLSAQAQSIEMVMAGRALQGLAAGPIEALCYVLIPVLFPPRLVPKVFGVEAVSWAVAAFGGPALAGYLTEAISWRAAFLVSVPLALIFMALVVFVVKPDKGTAEHSAFPAVRVLLLATGILAICVAGISQPLAAAGLVVVAMLLLRQFFVIDRRSAKPLLPRAAFTFSSPIGFGFWTIVMMAIAESAPAVFSIYGIQNLWGYSAFTAGAIGSLLAISWSFTQIAVSSFGTAAARRSLIWIGAATLVAALIVLTAGMALHAIWLVIAAQVMVGAAFGMNWGSLSQYLMESSSAEERNVTAALLPTSQMAGFAIGDATVGLIANMAGFADAKSAEDLRFALVIVFAAGIVFALPGAVAAMKAVRR